MKWLKARLRRWLDVPSLPECCIPSNLKLDRALGDFKNTLSEVQMLHQKLDATLEAIGYVAVAGDGVGVVAPLKPRALLRTKRVLEARQVVKEMHSILNRARMTERSLNEQADRISAEINEQQNPGA